MKLSGIFLYLSLSAISRASPASDLYGLQSVLARINGFSDLVGGVIGGVIKDAQAMLEESHKTIAEDAKGVTGDVSSATKKWIENGREFIMQNDLTYELVSHPSYKEYQIRVTEPSLCDPDVQQYSGYLDITEGKHLFFWFFESRESPDTAPLILWLNGGPGCSSTTGLLFELGPCNIANDGRNVTSNKHSWNTHANIIFLDQPVNVGFSFSDDGSTVNTSPVAGVDVLAFLQLFLRRYPKYASAPFHVAAESYGGTYAPNIASIVYRKNKELELYPSDDLLKINLASVMIGNGITDPYIQDATIPDFACDGPYPIYDGPDSPECNALRSKVPTCQRLIKSCYSYNSRLACVPAALYCNSQLYGPIQQSGLNPYDVRKTCDPEKDTSLCYKQMGWIETWMNEPAHKKALGVDPGLNFQSCNLQVNQAFLMQGDGMHNSALLLTDLINDGIRLLIYAGNADYMCNFIGNEAWLLNLDSKFKNEFITTRPVPWVTVANGKPAGTVRSAGGGGFTAGNVTFVTVHEAGHMVPFDQPEAALDLVVRWITDTPLSLNVNDFTAPPF